MITDKYIDPFTDFGFKHIFGKEKNKRFLTMMNSFKRLLMWQSF
jgi:hypothetical protein